MNKKQHFMPLEERIVLDAALVVDIGSVTFLDETDHYFDVDDSYESTEHEVYDTESTLVFESSEDFSEAKISAESGEPIDDQGLSELVVYNSPIEISVQEGQKDTVFDLSEIHPAGDLLAQMGFLNFEVAENSNPDEVTAAVSDSTLTLEYGDDASGDANVLVRGTYLDGKVYDTEFNIHIDSDETLHNPWLPLSYQDMDVDLKTEIFSTELAMNSTKEIDLAQLSQSAQPVVNELVGFFGNGSFEEGSWE